MYNLCETSFNLYTFNIHALREMIRIIILMPPDPCSQILVGELCATLY
jgi:hypothetical protein